MAGISPLGPPEGEANLWIPPFLWKGTFEGAEGG